MGAFNSRRSPGSTTHGSGFSLLTVAAVWEKGQVIAGYDPDHFRKDRCGAWMQYESYGDTKAKFGWEIDHDRPVAAGGGDDLANLQPLYWANNRHKSDSWPHWSCGYST